MSLRRVVRSNPRVELKQLGDLPAEQREPFRELEDDPEFFGLFVAQPPLAMNLKSVSRQAAALFESLATPAVLDLDEDLIDLVLDGILEIDDHVGRASARLSGRRAEALPTFVSGADALAILSPSFDKTATGLSRDALLHAQDLETSDPQTLSMALYLYNRMPLTPFWKAKFENGDAVLAHVGADRGSLRALLDSEWIAGGSARAKGWLNWTSRVPTKRTAADVTYKLYISPRPERIRDAFEIVVRVLAEFPGTPFKIGDDAAGLLRPDKLVAYFATRERMNEAANVLLRELAGCDAHGVPFTAALEESGLLSWGIDPPESDRALRWAGPKSWRLWVANRLGAAMAIAKSTSSPVKSMAEPWHFAIIRARRHGIDVETWTPSASLWSAA